MKFGKGISLFFIYPLVMFMLGFGCGVWFMNFFYPGLVNPETDTRFGYEMEYSQDYQRAEQMNGEGADSAESGQLTIEWEAAAENQEDAEGEGSRQVSAVEETLNADTEYVLQEKDLLRNTVVETTWQIPGKYIGMTRELFLTSMEEYAINPPLAEKERGFVGLQVLSFSPERVVVQMNYEYVQPSESFYIAVLDNEVVVLLEDGETVFINTGILLEELPEMVQMKIIQMYYIENEESLYNFLETYSS